ncbi:MAG: Lrp/AsnC family transcriptional regulator [Cognatishimia sp.]|jgi:DNA-binding Lrp family transcriptional regulator|uniref:Lrp/AsnC family transcriptional regulator n=1 Tax=Cognatishimia sp. TaxID=2211648 RepID=UPI004059B282
MPSLDEIDREILRHLQNDGKMSLQKLADHLNMSTSPCWRRVQRLQDDGFIKQYVAILDSKALGLNAQAYLQVTLIDHKEDTILAFENFVANEDQVVECASITGQSDFFLKVVAKDPEALEHFIMKRILRSGLVGTSNTNFILRVTKSSVALPV